MSSNDVRQLDVNMVNNSWSVPENEVSCMGVSLESLDTMMYRALERTRRNVSCSDGGNGVGQTILIACLTDVNGCAPFSAACML
jgi:hypothetical protein